MEKNSKSSSSWIPGILIATSWLAGCGSSNSDGVVAGGTVAGGGTPATCGAGYAPFSFGNGPGPEIGFYDMNRGNWMPVSMEYYLPGNQPLYFTQQFTNSGFGMTPQAICGSLHQAGRSNPPAVRINSYQDRGLNWRSGYYFYQWSSNYSQPSFGQPGFGQFSGGYRPDQVESKAFRVSANEVVVQSRSSEGGAILMTRYRLR